jgi:endonuclease/exonuclease/phosphatase family metal-dependent hydrolase
MKTLLKTLFLGLLFFISLNGQNGKNYFISSWNVENLFDTVNDAKKNDDQFTPNSEKQWTNEKLILKLNNLAKVINYMNNKKAPDIMAFEEVEHESLVDSIIKRIPGRNYKVVYAESPDARGIDNGLIYDTNKFGMLSYEAIKINLSGNHTTRYILKVKLIDDFNNKFYVFVNHWPSRLGGQEKSEALRIKAAETLLESINEIYRYDTNPYIICLGDFNDEPDNVSITETLKAFPYDCSQSDFKNYRLINMSYKKFKDGEGTIKFKGDFNLIDQIIISAELFNKIENSDKCSAFDIIRPEWMLQKDGSFKDAAIPTYGGKRFYGGYSDHLPVSLELKLK